MTNNQEEFSLSQFSVNYPYQSDLNWHSEERVLEALKELTGLNPKTKEYWKLKSELCYCIAANAIEQFSRGKYNAGILTRLHFEKIFRETLSDLEEKAGEEYNFF